MSCQFNNVSLINASVKDNTEIPNISFKEKEPETDIKDISFKKTEKNEKTHDMENIDIKFE